MERQLQELCSEYIGVLAGVEGLGRSARPRLHLCQWPRWRQQGLCGPGRVFTIMVRPRWFERGAGRVRALLPSTVYYDLARGGSWSLEGYRKVYQAEVRSRARELPPGALVATTPGGGGLLVEGGDTLCGGLHREWAAELLAEAGWQVVLDGRALTR